MKIKTVITKQSRYKQPFIFNNDTKALILSALAIFMGFITSIIPVITDLTIINSEIDNRFINYLNAFSEDNLPDFATELATEFENEFDCLLSLVLF